MASRRKGIMLCYPYEERRLKKWKPPWIIQRKLNGERCRAIIDGEGNATLLSSEENVFVSVPHINAALNRMGLRNIELDGELYIHGASREEIHGIVSREVNIHPDYGSMQLHCFDLALLLPQVDRSRLLLDTIPSNPYSPIQVVKPALISEVDEVNRALDEYMNEGYEGFILRNIDAPYMRKRYNMIMKFKPRKEDIYKIVGFQEEISIHGEPKGRLGSLQCVGDDATVFSVGSGSLLTDEGRANLWRIRESLVGKYARVKYQNITHARGVPCHAVIVEVI